MVSPSYFASDEAAGAFGSFIVSGMLQMCPRDVEKVQVRCEELKLQEEERRR
jgi:hypothetical protein